ncbi:MAG: autotransporter-associated beta strand repeat-containing protein [Verrucomicrobiaceae bacterium]|nr:autotransporter-associated beta strand repeat-containing protein [Verrucomicrobiaceae bacterium]
MRWRLKTPVTALLLGCFVLWTTPARALTGYWNFDGTGNWSNSGNWLGGTIPNGVGDIANFNFNIGSNRTVTLDAPVTLGGLVIGDTLGAQAYTFAGPGALTLDALGAAHASINKYNSTTDVWQAPLNLNDALDANIFAGILDMTGAGSTQIAISSSASDIIKNNGGNLRLNLDASAFNGNWIVNQGTLTIGGANANTAGNLGNGTGGIILNGTGLAAASVLSLNNNGTGSNGNITYTGNNDVVLQGAATINADRNYISGANTGNTIVLDNLTMNGGILGVTSANSYALRFNGTTTLVGDTNVFSVGNNSTVNLPNLTLGGVIDDGAKSRALIKEGTGRMVIANSANTYDGATVVKDGFLQIASGANLGTGKVFVSGGVLSLVAANQTGVATMPGGLNLVSQIGTTRAVLPVIGNTGFTIDSANPLNVTVPIYGMVLGVDGDIANNIDLSQIGGTGNTRVSVANVGGVNRTYTGTILPATDNTIRLNSAANIFIISGTNALGGATSTANVIAGLDYATPLNLPGVNITQGNTGTISVRGNNSATLGNVTVNRGITASIEGTGLTTPLGNGVVTALGGTVTTDATTDSKFGNTDFRLYGGSTLFIDNASVTSANADRRMLTTSNIDLTSSTFRLRGDGGAATVSSQAVNSIDYWGGSTLSIDTDGTTAGRLTTLTTGSLNRQGTATLNIRNIGGQATTFGTASATQKLLVTSAPTVTNGMIGANVALWAGTASNDAGDTRFATYTANGIEAATFNLTPTTATALQAATATQIVDFNAVTGTITMTASATMQALRLRTTTNTQILSSGAFTLTLGSAAAVGQGAGLQLEHTANNEVIHPLNIAFGTQEGMIYTATTGGTSGIVTMSGVLSGTNGITRFGDGILRLTGTNTFTGPLTINAGETRLNNVRAAGATTGTPNDINLWGGSLYFEAATQRYNNNVTFFNDARLGNVNVANTGFNNLAVAARTGSTAPVVLDIRVNGGSNQTTAYGGLTLNGPAQFYNTNLLQINGGISGSGRLEKFGNERLLIGGDSSGYLQPITVNTGVISSLNATSTAKPFGTGTITLNPGGSIRLAASSNINASQVTMNSDLGGIGGIGMSYVANPTSLPVMTINSSAPWKGTLGIGAVGFSQNIDQGTLWGGGAYLGALLGDTGIYTGTLTPDGTTFRLGTGQGTIRIDSPLTGASNSVQVGLSMTGDVGRADQAVNNAGGTVQFDVPMTYGGATVLQTNGALRISATTATTGIGAITLNGGILQGDSLVSNFRGIAPLSIANTIELTADSTIQMQNNAGDFRLAGPVNLASGSTGVVRQLTVGIDGTNAGQLYLDGGISDGTGGSGNHLIKAGQGAAFITTPVSYTGTTNITGGFLAINSPADLASSSQIVLSGGGLAVWENSMTLDRNVSIQSTANNTPGWFDVQAGLTLTQSAASTIEGPQNAAFTNSGMLMKRGLGTLILNGSNAMTGVLALDGILQINNQAALGDPARVGASDIQIGGDFAIGGTTTVTRFTGGTLRINDNVVTSRGIQFNNNSSSIYGGGIDVTPGNNFAVTGILSQGTDFDFWFKTGAGSLVTTGANTFRQFAMVGGTYQFGTSTPWANSTATSTDTTTIEMIGGTMRAVNAAASIALANNVSTTNYNYSGGMILQMESGVLQSIEFQADALTRQNQGTLVLQTMNGTTLGAAGSTNAARVIPTNAVNSGLARASALSSSGIFAPHLVAADSTGIASFVTDDATNGIKPYSGATLSSLVGSNPTSIADIGGTQTLSGSNSIFALRTTADINGGTLSIRAVDNVNMGGILINGSNTISSNVVFDPTSATAPGTGTPAEGLVYVKEGENAALSGKLLANAFTKFGRGTLTLSGGGAVLGDVSIQDGTVKVGATNPLSRMDSELNINSGATLDLNGNSIAVETLGSNNRQVTGTGGGVNFGGSVTNAAGGSAATLSMAGPQSSTFTGTINGNLKLMKAGSGVLTIDGYRASTPDSGSNTFTGGTNVYGVGTTGGLLIDNAPFAFGGANGSTPGDVNLYSGTLDFRYSGNATTFSIAGGTNGQQYNNLVVRIGADGTNGVTLNVKGPGLINVNQSTGAIGQGNIIQVGTLNMTDTSLSSSGANLYRFRAAGPVNIQGAQASFNTTSTGPAGMIELAGVIGGSGSLNKLGDTVLGAVVISGNANTYSGGTNIIAGEVQVTATSGTPLGSGAVRVFPTGTLRLAGNGSVNGAKLEVMSSATALGAISLDQNFNPTVLTSANFGSVYNNTLQLSQPYWTQPLDLAAIGDGRSFLGTGLGQEVKYMAATLGAGVADPAITATGVYRLVGGSSNLAFDGVNNVLTGNNYLQLGPQRGNVLAAPTNGGNAVVIRNSNNFTAGTQITEGTTLAIETGGSPIGETPLGSGAVEVYGTLQISGNLGSAFNASTGSNANTITLRPGGQVRIIDSFNTLVAGDQGRWGDTVAVDLNGGIFRLDGAANWQTTETIGDVTARKGGTLTVVKNSAASSAQLNVASLARADRGSVSINYTAGFLGQNTNTPLSYERLLVNGGVAVGGTTTNGSGFTNTGMAAPWIIDRVANTFVGYNTTTGFQPLISAAPGVGEVAYNKIVSGALSAGGLVAGDIADLTTAAKTLADNPTLYALRTNQNISPTAGNNTMTLTSGGLIMTAGTINPTSAITSGYVSPMTLNFGAGGGGEALIFVGAATSTIQAQIVAAQGLTKMGPNQLTLTSINPGIGAPVVINEGTLLARVPVAGGGSGAAVGTVFNGQDVILNGGALQLASQLANATGTASEIASNATVTGSFGSNVLVRADSTLGNNGVAQYVRINNLTIANAAGAAAMNNNGVIALALQSGIWVGGTTTLSTQARLNSTFNGMSQTTLAGIVTGAVIEKFGNGAITLLNGANNYSGGTIIHGAAAATATSAVASGFRGTGTPFGTGDITINPGGVLRLADNANIASNAVTMKSDDIGLAGIGIAHNAALPTIITSGSPSAGQIKLETTGAYGGAITLDYGYYSQPLNMSSVGNGTLWLGNSQQADAYYFNPSLGANANGEYQLGAGGNQAHLYLGGLLVSAGRQSLFENVFSGGTANSTRIEVGALTGNLAAEGPSFVNGNTGGIGLLTRNMNLTGDVRVNTNSTLNIGNNFALGSGRLVLNGGNIRVDAVQNTTIDNNVLLTGDFNTSNGNDFVINGNVAMHDAAYSAGATRLWNLAGTGTMGVYGVISGADGSNFIKSGVQFLLLGGANTYQGYTQINNGEIIAQGNVLPGVAGPLGISDSPIVFGSGTGNTGGTANVGGWLGIGGKFTIGRDIILGQTTGTGSSALDARTNERVTISGGISLIASSALTVGSMAANVSNFQGGTIDLAGPISGAGSLIIGTTTTTNNATTVANGGTVILSASTNGYGTNTFSGGVTLNSARLQIASDTYFTNAATNPTILSGPLGTGTFTFGAGESNRGGTIEAVGGARTIVNALGNLATASNTTLGFSGVNALTFTRDLNINSDATMRTRTFNVPNAWAPITFSGNLTNSGAGGATLIKNGVGTLVLTGTNTQADLLTTDANYGAGVVVNAGILRVNADAALGSTTSIAAGGTHLVGPADIKLAGGTLSASAGFTTARQLILTANSGVDVASGQSLTLSTATAGAFTITKTGPGTLALNNAANAQTGLTLGGQAQQNPAYGRFSNTGGTVSTTATSGTPFVAGAAGTVTINSGTLSLVGGASAQSLSIPRLIYGAAGHLAINQGTTTSTLTASEAAATAFQRAGTLNSVSFGTLALNTSVAGALGGNEKVLISNAAAQPANTAGTGGSILSVPSIVTAVSGSGQDADFVRYDATNGFMAHNVTTVTALGATAPTNVGDISAAGSTAGAGIIDVLALRTAGNITPTDGTSLVRILGGGLILNGSTAPNISANVSFNSGSAAIEALTYVRDGQSGASILSGSIAARDFTKFGPGTLELSGTANVLTAGTARLPVLSVQEGTLRFANAGALFQNGSRGNETGLFTLNVNESGVFDTNGLALSIAGITGNGTILGGGALTSRNGFGVDLTFGGGITGTSSFTKSGDGILTMTGFSTYSGGTSVEAGRIVSAIPLPNTNTAPGLSLASLGTLDARGAQALGTGPITLKGGILAINNNIAHAEVEDGIDFNTFGPGNGYDITVANVGATNGIALPGNMTSTIYLNSSNTATLTGNSAINSLTIDAPQLNIAGLANNSGNLSLLFVKGATNFSQPNTVLDTNGGRLFLGGQINANGKTITKIGLQDVVLSNTELDAGQNQVGLWKVYGGVLNPRVADGASNPLGSGVTVELNGGTTGVIHLNLSTDGNGTTLSERISTYQDTNLRFGSMLPVTSSEFVMTGASRVNTDRIVGNNSNKTTVINNLEAGGVLGSPYVYFTGAATATGDNFWVNGTTKFVRDLYLQNDVALTLNGVISGQGTFVKRFGTTIYVNADNTTGYNGGTILTGTALLFGSLEGNQITLNDTAKLGKGHVVVNANGQLQFNSASNLQAGQNVYVSSNLDNFGVLRLAANLTLDQVNFRAAGVGGAQATASNYYLTSTNPGGGVLALNTVYSNALNMRSLGDGTWFLGSTTNGVGANGSYDAATLAPGFNNTYRLGAGGSTLFFGSNGASNVITNTDASCISNLVVGAPMSVQNNAVIGNGAGNVVFLTSQNYGGTTVINRSSTLDFRGTLNTSGIETYGGLNVAGETGTFLKGGTGANIPVTLRPGSTLRFDNTSAGVLPVASTQGRWADGTGIDLDNATLRLQGNAAVEVSETVGAIAAKGGSFIEVVRGVAGRGTELRTPGITRVGAGTITFNTNSETLGSDERVIITGTAPVVTNGMVSPWMISNTNTEFITYNADTGFSKAGFTNVQVGGTTAATLSLTNDRVLFGTATTAIGNGFDINAWAARLDVDLTLATASNATSAANRLVLGSGGLITTGTRQINAGLVAGAGASELLIFNTGTTTIGDSANITTSGQIAASSITKSGAGTLALQAVQGIFSGNINVNQGALTLGYNPTGATGSVTVTPIVNVGGAGGTIFLNGPNVSLNLNGGNDAYAAGVNTIFNNSVTIGDYNPIVQLVANRFGGAITGRRVVIGGNFTFGANTAETGQIARFTSGNAFDWQLGDSASDTVTLVGKSVFDVDNGGTAGQPDLTITAKVTGTGTLVKSRIDTSSDLMLMENVTNLNDFSGGTIVTGGTLRVYAKANNVAAAASTNITAGGLGTGAITLMGGTLDLRVDNDVGGAADTNAERTFFSAAGNGLDLIVNGSATLNVDRTGLVAAGTTKQIAFNSLTIGSQILTVSGGNTYSAEIAGTTTLKGNLFLNNSVDVILGGDINDGGAGLFINKINTGVLWVNSATNTLGGGAFINAGMLRFGTPRADSTTAQLGSGLITINPDAEIRVNALTNINTTANQKIDLISTAYAPAVLRTAALTQAQYQSILTTTSSGQLALLGTESNALDMSTLGDGRMYLGSVEADRTYNAATLAPGLADLGGTNRVYRLGTRNSGNLIVNLSGTGNLTDVGGVTDVRIGSLANLGPQGSWGIGNVLLQDQNTYTGSTTIVRGSSLRFDQANTLTAGSLGALTGATGTSAAAIHTYGILRVEGTNGSFVDSTNSANAYTNITLHPGSELRLQDVNTTGAAANRWHDSAAIGLNGSLLTLQTANAVVTGAETVGAISFDRGSRIQPLTQSTAQLTLNTPSLTRVGSGTMVFLPSAAGRLGLAPGANSERVIVTGTAPTATNSMLPGYFISAGADQRFVSYDNTNGVTLVADAAMTAFAGGMTAGTAIVNVTAATNLPDMNPTIYALRTAANISSPTGSNNDATITFGGSGANVGGLLLINGGADNTTTLVSPNLKFGTTGANEALIYFQNPGGTNRTATLAGNITATGVTKFGTGLLIVANDQSDAARGVGNGYSNGWVVNEGTLQLGTFGSAGNAVVGNTITLNGSQVGAAQLNLRAQPQNTLLNYSYTSGKIIAVDNAIIDWDPGANDRVHTIADIEVQQAGGNGPVDAQLRFANNRARSILATGQLTLTNNAIINVDTTADQSVFYAYTTTNTNLTTGTSSGISVANLNGSGNFTKWGDGYLYVRGASPTFTGNVVIDQGAVQVNDNNALGSGSITVNRYGILDIAVANYTPTATYNDASVERWSIDGARTGTVNLGLGTLQVAANQSGTATVVLNGGSIEGWLRSDDVTENNRNSGVFRNLGPNISITLAGNSLVGTQFYEGANGLDMGKQTNDSRPLEEYFGSGVILDIQGVISGAGKSLTKVGYDTVILSGANTYTGGTNVNGGKLLLGRNDALAITGDVATNASGVLDLNGSNQTVARLSNAVNPAAPSTNSGYITNSAASVNTLTVGNGVATNFTYSGVIQNNVALTKTGGGALQLDNANTYLGKTTVSAGAIKLGVSGSIDDSPWIEISPAAMLDVTAKTGGYAFDGTITGGGADAAGTTFATVTTAARIAGNITVGDHIGEVCLIGNLSPGGSSSAADIITAGNQIGHIYTSGNVTLSGGLVGSSPIVPETRLAMQLAGSTTTLAALGYTGGNVETFIDGLTGTEASLNGGAGNLAGHDYVNVGGTLTLNANGRIVVTNFGSYTPSFGDVFNLLDWGALTNNGFVTGARYQSGNETNVDLDLPVLANASLSWDTSRFAGLGVVVVVPEPGRCLLLLFGLASLLLRRRRAAT